MSVRVRFAPSPTGNVHIGNIRAAIFNWLFARHSQGTFLLRIEDTDRERSTPEAIRTLLEVMDWLGLNYDEAPLYQTTQVEVHRQAAEKLIAAGHAYRHAKGGEAGAAEAILFRIPWDAEAVPGVSTVGPVEVLVHAETPVTVSRGGIGYAQVSSKGKPMPQAGCLAGYQHLEIVDAAGTCRFRLDDHVADLLAGRQDFTIEGAAKLRFTRRQVMYHDLVKGDLAKPLDSLRDFVIVRGDGNPVFHLANVCDDVTQQITHIIRGDDHVENTYRHVFLFHALGAAAPQYAHLPMIVNAQGKPYSKRDGDAYVGDFREKGFLPETLFNYLTLLGWSPGDDREKLARTELVELFTLDRCQSSSAQMDLNKLLNLNGLYMAELPPDVFAARCRDYAARYPWSAAVEPAAFAEVAGLLQSRTKAFSHIEQWAHFFAVLPAYDEKACAKLLADKPVRDALNLVIEELADLAPDGFTAAAVEAIIHGSTAACAVQQGKLNQPLRVAVTGSTIGAGIYETIALLGKERTLQRLRHTLALGAPG